MTVVFSTFYSVEQDVVQEDNITFVEQSLDSAGKTQFIELFDMCGIYSVHLVWIPGEMAACLYLIYRYSFKAFICFVYYSLWITNEFYLFKCKM